MGPMLGPRIFGSERLSIQRSPWRTTCVRLGGHDEGYDDAHDGCNARNCCQRQHGAIVPQFGSLLGCTSTSLFVRRSFERLKLLRRWIAQPWRIAAIEERREAAGYLKCESTSVTQRLWISRHRTVLDLSHRPSSGVIHGGDARAALRRCRQEIAEARAAGYPTAGGDRTPDVVACVS